MNYILMNESMIDLIDIGLEVKRLRLGNKLTQKALAQKAGLAQADLSRLESGQMPEIGTGRLLRILQVLGCELDIIQSRRITLDDVAAENVLAAEFLETEPLCI